MKKEVIEVGVRKLSTVLTAKYESIHGPQKKLGVFQDKDIQNTFIEFQKRFYKHAPAG